MNKTSSLLAGIGAVILIIVLYFVFHSTKAPVVNTETNAPAMSDTVEVSVDNKTGSDEVKLITVTEGQKVVISITSDVEAEAHLHGYDIEVELQPGVPNKMVFVADKTGRFSLEIHGVEKEIGILEVHPK